MPYFKATRPLNAMRAVFWKGYICLIFWGGEIKTVHMFDQLVISLCLQSDEATKRKGFNSKIFFFVIFACTERTSAA